MYAFDYVRPASTADAAAQIATGSEAKFVAGGMTLIPALKLRLARPGALIDLGGVPGLRGIREEAGGVTIGAMTTHAEVAASETVRRLIPALAELAGVIGDPQVRHRGTIGGSIANHDPAADYPAAVLGLNATVRTDKRQIPADQFFTGLFSTALAEDELVTEVHFPKPETAGYAKFRNPASRYAIVGVFVARTGGAVRVGVTGASQDGAFRSAAIEQALAANWAESALDGVTLPAQGLNGDIHASAEYRAHLVTVMAKRALAGAR